MMHGRLERVLLGLFDLALRTRDGDASGIDGEQMRWTFLDVVRDARRRGRSAALIVALRECGDVIWSGLRERRPTANGQGDAARYCSYYSLWL
jgi:hypothetical protein